MNLKERGITVGDLLLVTAVIAATVFIVNMVKNDDKQSALFNQDNSTIIQAVT